MLLTMETWRLEMEPLRVSDSHHDEEQDPPDLDPHLSDKSDPDPH